jgi:PPOX class probable F420-dependent enzyme
MDGLAVWARRLLAEQRVAHLGLVDDGGHPRVLPVTYAIHDGAVWTAVDNKPKRGSGELARVRWARRRPGAALTIDRYDDDWSRLAWLQLIGEITVFEGAPAGPVLDALAARYHQYRGDPPPGPLLRLVPTRAVCWRASDDRGA